MRLCFAFLLIAGLGALPSAGPAHAQAEKPFRKHIIVASDPLAVEAGLAVLREGGSAADAVIAAQMVLALVEPQASGLGGGALALSFNSASREVLAWDGRETAPAAAGPDLFLGRDGKQMAYLEAAIGGRAVGVPGALRMLEALHRAQGRLPWDRLIAPAIEMAETGFPVSASLSAAISTDGDRLRRQSAARTYFFLADGTALPQVYNLVNQPLAETLRAIAAGGADALLRGPIASDIATLVRNDPNPGLMTTDDLAAITAPTRPAVCGPYRTLTVCGMGPPSAGGIAVLQILGLLDHFDLKAMDPAGMEATHLLTEAEKLAYADRAVFLADSDFVPVPIHGLLDPAYLSARARLIDAGSSLALPVSGTPKPSDPALAPASPHHGGSQIVAIDDDGNAVSLSSTLQDAFGSGLLVHGLLLNNSMTDFAFVPRINDAPVANRIEGGKRPRSSMSPTLVLTQEGELHIAAGVQGGSRAPSFMTQALVRMIDFGMTPQQALAAPTFAVAPETGSGQGAAARGEQVTAGGQTATVQALADGQQAVLVTLDGLIGASDPRRDGAVAGD